MQDREIASAQFYLVAVAQGAGRGGWLVGPAGEVEIWRQRAWSGFLGEEVEEPLVQITEAGHGFHQLRDELAVAAVQVGGHGMLNGPCAVLVDEPGGEPVISAGVVEVIVSVECEDIAAGQCFGHLADVADAQARVDQGGCRVALDQEAVDAHGFADQVDSALDSLGGEPAVHGAVLSASETSTGLVRPRNSTSRSPLPSTDMRWKARPLPTVTALLGGL